MSERLWPSLTDWREISLGGLLPTISEEHLSPFPSIEHAEALAVLQGTVGSYQQELAFSYSGDAEDVKKRWLGCALLFAMPKQGLEEALTSLMDILEFNFANRYLKIAPVTTIEGSGKFVDISERPDIVINE